jgi:hypothetical protein
VKTQFDANFLELDSKLDEYRDVCASVRKTLPEVMAAADEPGVVADVVLEAASAARPKLRYTAARAGLIDTGIRKDLRLDPLMASRQRHSSSAGATTTQCAVPRIDAMNELRESAFRAISHPSTGATRGR